MQLLPILLRGLVRQYVWVLQYQDTYWQRGYFFLFFPFFVSLSLPLLSCSLSFCVLGVSARIKCSICFCFSRTASHEESGRQDEWSCGSSEHCED